MATAARTVICQLQTEKSTVNNKIVLQPRVCTLRSYGSERSGMMKVTEARPSRLVTVIDGAARDDNYESYSSFFASLSEYIENSKKGQDMETISGRLAMVVFAATVTMELVTGNSLFQKMDVQGIMEATGVCFGAILCAAIFAWVSSARNKVGRIFAISCNSFIDSLIDNLIDGLFFEGEFTDE